MGAPPLYVVFVMIMVRSLYLFVVLKIIKEYIVFTFVDYFKKVLYPIFKQVLVSLLFIFALEFYMNDNFGLFLRLFIQVSVLIVLTFFAGMDKSDRNDVIALIKGFISKRK
jgi:ABC-type transport system involved in cytochrome bd biosynthesis fused ATPase/permease subunit